MPAGGELAAAESVPAISDPGRAMCVVVVVAPVVVPVPVVVKGVVASEMALRRLPRSPEKENALFWKGGSPVTVVRL
ncbi:hypothetical protein KQX54_004127 [Cotesia glomerata]|uniref:Uncharacterized protein n=1 Tax=Cotesia glomerata TaxID=32391 RepID=A0AAV7I806_COTGL|nr:hypothetical protein KQX54_004127 [Cotesia glomerata]